MSRRDDDSVGHIPKMAPAHDEIASYQRTRAKGGLASSIGEVPDIQGPASSVAMKTILTAVVLVLLVTASLSGYLYMKLQAAERSLHDYQGRIADLEQRLMVTDESMSESSVAMKVKIREMDSEIRKLWDNVWKKSKKRLEEHDALLSKHQQSIKASDAFISSAKKQLAENKTVVAGLTGQLRKAEQLQAQVAANQQQLSQQQQNLESAADKANRVGGDLVKLDRRVKGTEEWVESINGFRRQVNRDISSLKKNVGQLQATP